LSHNTSLIMKSVILFIAIFLAVQVHCGTFQWKSCAQPGDPYTVSTVTMTPDPAVRGKPVTVTVSGTSTESTTTASTWASVTKYGPLTVSSLNGTVCSIVTNCKCPCPAGTITTSLTTNTPNIAPLGTYTGTLKGNDGNGHESTCVTYSFQMSSSADADAESESVAWDLIKN